MTRERPTRRARQILRRADRNAYSRAQSARKASAQSRTDRSAIFFLIMYDVRQCVIAEKSRNSAKSPVMKIEKEHKAPRKTVIFDKKTYIITDRSPIIPTQTQNRCLGTASSRGSEALGKIHRFIIPHFSQNVKRFPRQNTNFGVKRLFGNFGKSFRRLFQNIFRPAARKIVRQASKLLFLTSERKAKTENE